jgi:hypothetical protein
VALVVKEAVEALGIEKGIQVYAAIKATAFPSVGLTPPPGHIVSSSLRKTQAPVRTQLRKNT